MNHRLFIASPLPDIYNRVIENFRASQPENSYRWISAQNRHMTLLFIGNFESDSLKLLKEKLYVFFQQGKAFSLTPEKFMYAPTQRKVRMIWLRFYQSEAYNQLVIGLNHLIKQYFYEQGKFYNQPLPNKLIPHVTIARFKPHRAFKLSLSDPEIVNQLPEFPLSQAYLMSSKRFSTGAEYELIQSYSLGHGS